MLTPWSGAYPLDTWWFPGCLDKPLQHQGICSQLIWGNTVDLIKMKLGICPFFRFPEMAWEDIFLGMVVTGSLIMSFYFLTEQLLGNLRERLPASIICHLSLGLPLFYCSARIWPVTLVPLWLLRFLCAPYIPILLNQAEKEGWVSFVPLQKYKTT